MTSQTVPLIDVVKRRGSRPTERFNPDKLRSSIEAACLSVHSFEGSACDIADRVVVTVITWCAARPEVTSDDLRRQAGKALAVHHPEAAYFYQQNRSII